MKYITQALDTIKSDSIALNTKGFIIFNKGKEEKNKQYFTEAMTYFKLAQLTAKNDQEKLLPLYHMGMVNLELKNFDLAIKYFDDVLKINYRFAEAINGKAIIYNNNGESGKAIDAVKEALRYNPSLTAAQESLIKLTVNLGNGRQSFWNFWNTSWSKRIAAILLVIAAFSVITYPLSQYSENITTTKSYGNNSTNGNYSDTTITTTSPQLKIDNSYLIVFGIIIFILLLPEIQRAKIGGIVELETSNQPLPIAKSSLP